MNYWILMSSHLIMFIRKFSSSSHISSIEEGCTGSKYYIPQSYFSKLSKVLSIFLLLTYRKKCVSHLFSAEHLSKVLSIFLLLTYRKTVT
jgi:hypothetical protein